LGVGLLLLLQDVRGGAVAGGLRGRRVDVMGGHVGVWRAVVSWGTHGKGLSDLLGKSAAGVWVSRAGAEAVIW
jgi:hypothetical protein